MTYEILLKSFLKQTKSILDEREGLATFWIMLFHLNKWSRIQFEMNRKKTVDSENLNAVNAFVIRLKTGEPVHYITGKTEFYGVTHLVNRNALIPRPETEELVDWIVSDNKLKKTQSVLDIGTGSGCIINSLALNLNGRFYGLDVSNDALSLAKANSKALETTVHFFIKNILNTQDTSDKFDTIVSNPPYIPVSDKKSMGSNVLDFEPELALFVPNTDPLIFYKAIINFGLKSLNMQGCIYFEIHENYSSDLKTIIDKLNCKYLFKKDMQGKDRMLKIWDLV